MNADIKKEDEAQRKYLADCIAALKERKERDAKVYNEDNMNNMQKNTDLITDIGKLRDLVKTKKEEFKTLGGDKMLNLILQKKPGERKQEQMAQEDIDEEALATQKQIAVQKDYISRLQSQLADL